MSGVVAFDRLVARLGFLIGCGGSDSFAGPGVEKWVRRPTTEDRAVFAQALIVPP
jgi:hypothetical protein